LGAAILAAGASARMGLSKMLLPWGGTTVIGHLIRLWREQLSAGQVVVVGGAFDRALQLELDRLAFPPAARILNPDTNGGMFSSVQCAARWSEWDSGVTHVAIVLGDQPHLKPITLAILIEASRATSDKICQPSLDGRPRHPVVMPIAIFRELAVSHAKTLKQFLESSSGQIRLSASQDAGLDLDIDRPEDYATALSLAFGRTTSR
jgi:molybdenum cofactor cytidylyltransferase